MKAPKHRIERSRPLDVPRFFIPANLNLCSRMRLHNRCLVLRAVLVGASMFPAVVAGSIFTFSLTLGDYITPTLVSNTKFIGNVVYDFMGIAGNQPFAAAYAMVPVTIMLVYLLIARRLGAFEAL